MSNTITMSFSAPIELSIQMEEYMELTGFNRSELIKASLMSYLDIKNKEKDFQKLLEEIYKDVIDIKRAVSGSD